MSATVCFHRTIVEMEAPKNLITMQREPDMEVVHKLTSSPHIRLMAGTGGIRWYMLCFVPKKRPLVWAEIRQWWWMIRQIPSLAARRSCQRGIL